MSASAGTVGSGRRDSLPGDRETAALLTSGAISGLTLAVAFGLLALGVESFWVVFVVGFGVLLPLSIGVVASLYPEDDHEEGDTADDETRSAMAELRLQYARGEIDEAELERRAEVLAEQEA